MFSRIDATYAVKRILQLLGLFILAGIGIYAYVNYPERFSPWSYVEVGDTFMSTLLIMYPVATLLGLVAWIGAVWEEYQLFGRWYAVGEVFKRDHKELLEGLQYTFSPQYCPVGRWLVDFDYYRFFTKLSRVLLDRYVWVCALEMEGVQLINSYPGVSLSRDVVEGWTQEIERLKSLEKDLVRIYGYANFLGHGERIFYTEVVREGVDKLRQRAKQHVLRLDQLAADSK